MQGSQESLQSCALPKFVLDKVRDYKKEGEKLICLHCQKTYTVLDSIRSHIKKKHYSAIFGEVWNCTECPESFNSECPLTAHKLLVHNIDTRYKCNACDKAFNSQTILTRHLMNYHMLGTLMKCNDCDYQTYSRCLLIKHTFKHRTAKDFHCRFCGKSFMRKNNLVMHEKIHTGDKRKVCGVCKKAFVQKASLNYHMAKYHPGFHL